MLRSSIRGTTNATVSAMAPSKPTRMVAAISRMTAFYVMGLGNSVNKRSRPRIGQVTDVGCEGVLANSPQSNETARIEDSAEGRKAKGRRAQAEGAAAQGVAQGSCAVRQAERRARHVARRRRLIEFSVLGNHLHRLHLLVEADSSLALSRGMQGLNVRFA